MDSKKLAVFFDQCFNIFSDEHKFPNTLRQRIITRICIPTLNHISLYNLKEFFKTNIKLLAGHVETKFTKFSEQLFESQLINKICSYKILLLMYQSFGKDELSSSTSELVRAFLPNPTTGKEMTTFLSR